jgi:hypothetical protein
MQNPNYGEPWSLKPVPNTHIVTTTARISGSRIASFKVIHDVSEPEIAQFDHIDSVTLIPSKRTEGAVA